MNDMLGWEIAGGITLLMAGIASAHAAVAGQMKDGSIRDLTNLPDPERIDNNRTRERQALLAEGHDFHSVLGYRIGSMELMEAVLRERGYQTTSVKKGYLDIKKVEALLAVRQVTADENSSTVFYFTGHGDREARGVLMDNEVLEPEKLYEMLRPIKGKKAIIIDACHSGCFTEEAELSDYVVIAACPKDKQTRSAHRGYDGHIGLLTYGLFQELHKGPQDVSTMPLYAGTSLERLMQRVRPEKDISFEVQRVSDTEFIL